MGMYTELHFNAGMIRDLPRQIVDTLSYMTDQVRGAPVELPRHPLFDTQRWDFMLRCDSAYFPATPASSLDYDEDARRYYLHVRCNLKNYDGEIGKFLDWVMPYVDADTECLGYHRHEENDHPTLIYKIAPDGAR